MSPGDSDTPPQSPLFANAPGASQPQIPKTPWSEADLAKIDQLKRLIADGKFGSRENDRGGRAQLMMPFLLVRSFTGDNGTRPFNQTFWESPDIWTAVGEPAATPAIPPTHGGVLPAGQPNTVYAHVWNIGRAPSIGVLVEFYWFNPSLAIDGSHAHLIGMTRVDLGPRNSPSCHRLVKCPTAWVPVMENGGHECLVVKVSGFGDQAAPAAWSPWQDRHVAQRNVAVVSGLGEMKSIISRLDLTLLATSHVQLTHAGVEGKDAVQIVAPHLTLDPTIVDPRTLVHLGAAGARRVAESIAAHPPAAATTTAPAAVVDQRPVLEATLLEKLSSITPPSAGHAQVVRISQYDGTQLTGGYTLVVGAPT